MANPSIAFITAHRLESALSHTPTIRFLKRVFPDSDIFRHHDKPRGHNRLQRQPKHQSNLQYLERYTHRSIRSPIRSLYQLLQKKDAISILQSTYGPQLILSGITQDHVIAQSKEPQKRIHVAVKSVEKLRQLFPNAPEFDDYRYKLPFSENDQKKVDKQLQEWGIATQPLIRLHLVCRSIDKRFGFWKKELVHEKAWRVEHANRFCELLAKNHPEVRCITTGIQDEGTYTRPLARTYPNVIDAVDMFSIKEAAALMHHLKACIVPDTGMLHIVSNLPSTLWGSMP
jgi:ADP-heptose:LPS heptosyltransferase